MSETTTRSIKCDQCGKELIQHTSYPHVFALELRPIDVNINDTGFEYSVAVYPPINRMHFCNTECLLAKLSPKPPGQSEEAV